VSLSKMEKDHPEIELKYLPPYQQKKVKATIAENDLDAARTKVSELAVQASACKKDAERHAVESQSKATTGKAQAGTATASSTSKTTPNTSASATKPQTAPTATPGPTLSEEEQKVVSLCGKQ